MKVQFAAAAVLLVLLRLSPVFAAERHTVLEDYPRYGKSPSAEQLRHMDPVVEDVVQAIKAGAVATVRLVGHADFDANGRAFETRVSEERAAAAQQTLLAKISARASLEGISQDRLWANLNMSAKGMGTREPVVTNPRSEEERKRNRRVDIHWVSPEPRPRPAPRPVPTPIEIVERVVGFGIWSGPAKVVLVGEQSVTFKITNTNPLLGTTIVIELDPRGPKQSRQIPPLGTVEITFSEFGRKLGNWHFDIATNSDSFAVAWSATSFAPPAQ